MNTKPIIDAQANLMSALYFTGTLTVPEEDVRLNTCEDNPEGCSWVHEVAEPEVGLEAQDYCETHTEEMN